jgi:hypothetical protein
VIDDERAARAECGTCGGITAGSPNGTRRPHKLAAMGLMSNLRRVATSKATQEKLLTTGAQVFQGLTGGRPPALDTLVTADEIEAVTGARVVGTPRTNGAGSDGDVGRQYIWEAQLENGDKFLITLIAGNSAADAQLAMSRVAQVEKPYEGVGERATVRVKKYRKTGSSEVGVNALQGRYTLALTHTSKDGRTDQRDRIGELLRVALTRL